AQALEVGVVDVGLVVAPPLPDVRLEGRQRRPQVDEQVRRPEGRGDGVVEQRVAGVVARVEEPVLGEEPGEDVRVLVHRAVLDHAPARVHLAQVLPQTRGEEEDLRVEGVAPHVGVEVGEVGVLVDGLEDGGEVVPLREDARERRLAGADVAGDRDVETAVLLLHDGTAASRASTRATSASRSPSSSTKSMTPASTTSTGKRAPSKYSS